MITLKLKELLEEHNIKPIELANMLNLSGKAHVYEWLTGVCFPNFETLINIADCFNCSLEYLLGRTEDNSEIKFKNPPQFDKQLKEIMKLHKATQYSMHKDGIVNPSNFNLWFSKKSMPKVETLIKLADYFKISVDELVGRV